MYLTEGFTGQMKIANQFCFIITLRTKYVDMYFRLRVMLIPHRYLSSVLGEVELKETTLRSPSSYMDTLLDLGEQTTRKLLTFYKNIFLTIKLTTRMMDIKFCLLFSKRFFNSVFPLQN